MGIQVDFSKLSCMLLCAFLFLLTGCSGRQVESASVQENAEEAAETRPTGQLISGGTEEELHTAFFDFKLVSVTEKDYFSIGDEVYRMEDGYRILICKLSVTNTMEQETEIFIDDFLINWGEESSDCGYGYTATQKKGYLEDSLVLQSGETVERKLMFEVPVADGYSLIYDEYYGDGYQGNSYQVTFDVE